MKRDETGIKRISSTCWSVRVERRDERRGRTCNRKVTVVGTKADAIAKRDELRAELASATKPERLQLRVYAPRWLERRTIKDGTRRRYAYAIAAILEVLGELYVDALTPADVERYLKVRLAAAYAGNTVKNELRVLRVIAKDSVAEGIAQRYWCDRVKAPEVSHYDDDDPNLLTPAESARVIAYTPSRWRGFVLFMLTTGARIGEATALRWEDLEYLELDGIGLCAVAQIRRGNYRGAETTVKTKGSKRTIVVLPEVLAELGTRRSSGLMFATRRGTMHRGSPLRRALEKACDAAKVRRITTHGTRRTFNNEGRQLAHSREVLKAITGHETDEMVSHYSHVGSAEKAQLISAVAKSFGVRPTSVLGAEEQRG